MTYDQLTDAQRLLVKALFCPTQAGFAAYTYKITQGGWSISRRKTTKPKP